ncbi:cytochrome P450/oxidoreductase [Modicisalibacter tunisiensis]|uniref:Cytochrome P450/oxidoreductase n=1 Tax=Modicisalibacter tunisiensis TaxID=390637 RepID=A0ABS7WVI2_9GAMM|nr:cytochrome P450/oxidoreductase [Modicisalibacter tunisiensis]MBZ9566623.1 cytochrome P450/oxidoreductase [Modicisalibacter tunisiensis]
MPTPRTSPRADEGRCPFRDAASHAPDTAPNGCPVSPQAASFDPFESDYQLDPAEALRWSRDQEPVFYSPRLGYWVVSRYADVKAIFRDNRTFSPSIALEKITPTTQAAQDTLQRYGYAMNRTLVNEDEPAHMERRRALMKSFELEELAHHEPMVRRLTREYLDRLVDKGEADLVDEMLWEIPLTVALHFLGVPEEDMDTLREYSIAHTVNTWGRPSPDEQVAVAEAVGKFWQYAGQVLEKMRQDPAGHGWMKYAIRRQQELPEVVTDSYLHSMMMAGIVAAHETTAHATANMLRLLLENRAVWEDLCANPSLIPNAVEECLRLSGSVAAWRRIATTDTQVGDVAIPQGAKLLIVSASANHDGRHFENPDELDIYRDNTTDHLTFGYGSHQCMGKNLARLEMRIFLEEFTRRLPHMTLVPDQTFTFVPNTSFRGPEHLWVRWDPARNPERRDNSLREQGRDFPLGAPSRRDAEREAVVTRVIHETPDVIRLVLEDPRGRPLPRWTPGAHIDLVVGDITRKYSLCGDPDDEQRLEIAIRREEPGRGGSRLIHDTVKPQTRVRLRGPRNHFRLDETADGYLLIAGGIGITPIIAMADRLKRLGKRYAIHYAGRSRGSMPLLERLKRDHGDRLCLYPADEGRRLDLPAVVGGRGEARVYACGPARLLDALAALTRDDADAIHVEHFSASHAILDPRREQAFEVELSDSELTVPVAADQTVLQALRAVGVDVPSDCEEGLCGTCEVAVMAGEVDHRDKVLSADERAASRRMMTCCSRAKRGKLVLGL